jgi:hypothetical protein
VDNPLFQLGFEKLNAHHVLTDPAVYLRRFESTLPHPLATTFPFFERGVFLLAFSFVISPPKRAFWTSAAFVFLTTVLPFAPSLFFFAAVDLLSLLERDLAFAAVS